MRRLIRQWLNGIFIIGAVVGLLVYFLHDDTLGTYILLAAMVPKMAEASMRIFTTWCVALLVAVSVQAQDYTDDYGTLAGSDGTATQTNRNFNPHNNDTTRNKQIPRGIYVWTIDRRFGDIARTTPDTLPHLFPRTVFASGRRGEYNITGNNFSPRLSRFFIDRPEASPFLLTQGYDQLYVEPDEWHFTNTLSPITNLSYNNCGDKTNGEDHLQARFAVNAGKRTGFGFDINYAYARGFYQNQAESHFGATLYGSHIGDRYQMHAVASLWRIKEAQNGGVVSDDYLLHPELFTESYASNDIATILSQHWNRTHRNHLFLNQRYSVGFYRKVPLTPEELAARQFARESRKDKDTKQRSQAEDDEAGTASGGRRGRKSVEDTPSGRPDGATIAHKAVETLLPPQPRDSVLREQLLGDTTRILVENKAQQDSLLAEKARQDSIDATMKDEYVPVTSFIHTLELNHSYRNSLAYSEPTGYYADTCYSMSSAGFDDEIQLLQVKNTLAVALLEGFNKWAKAGLKLFATHEFRRYTMNDRTADMMPVVSRQSHQNISIGAQLQKMQGRTLHYGLTAESWIAGEDFGALKLDAHADLNFPLFGDTVRLEAKGHLHRLIPAYLQRHYHSKHFWWDDDLDKEVRMGVEGIFTIDRTHTRLRVAVEQVKNYTFLGMQYTDMGETRVGLRASMQQSSNLNVLTAQLSQDLALGPLHFDNIVTLQNSSDKEVLPLPVLNVFSNLYLKFRIARVLACELGACATYFTRYEAPDYVPALGLYAVQQNADSRVTLGNFPFADAYANFHLKQARFFIAMGNLLDGKLNRMAFLAPHYPTNGMLMRVGVSWNFYN